jgi:hypothetical protein
MAAKENWASAWANNMDGRHQQQGNKIISSTISAGPPINRTGGGHHLSTAAKPLHNTDEWADEQVAHWGSSTFTSFSHSRWATVLRHLRSLALDTFICSIWSSWLNLKIQTILAIQPEGGLDATVCCAKAAPQLEPASVTPYTDRNMLLQSTEDLSRHVAELSAEQNRHSNPRKGLDHPRHLGHPPNITHVEGSHTRDKRPMFWWTNSDHTVS